MATKPIEIDLDDLTPAKVRRALKNVGDARYAAPCIIGTLIPAQRRRALDRLDDYRIGSLVRRGVVKFAKPGQARTAATLQDRFDSGEPDWFRRHPFVKKLLAEKAA
jgi:hypothetical protein